MIFRSLPIEVQTAVLRRVAPPVRLPIKTVYDGKSKLAASFGSDFLKEVEGLTVMDFGCGFGLEVVELALAGAKFVIGVEIETTRFEAARRNAEQAGVADRCHFSRTPVGPVDMVISLDSFEHYADPDSALATMYDVLRPGGSAWISFGPPWYHPHGQHLPELPLWSHVWFSEEAVIRWRRLMRGGEATRYIDIGLNGMTVSRFERLVARGGFEIESFEPVPIRALNWMHNRLTREFTTSVVRCRLRKPSAPVS